MSEDQKQGIIHGSRLHEDMECTVDEILDLYHRWLGLVKTTPDTFAALSGFLRMVHGMGGNYHFVSRSLDNLISRVNIINELDTTPDNDSVISRLAMIKPAQLN